ncbi:MAG: C-GCAxxG-C-C family protein [Desulforhopalus sp.]|nr:C-GCAxxG-C-C family protein [Desulforhopalus sp.]
MDGKMIAERVYTYYHLDDLNCVTTTLKILAEKCNLPLDGQVLDAAVGMHGAGGYRAQCGLVEGTLMFLGILGRAKGFADQEIIELCCRYAESFEEQFSSLLCRELRPAGFAPDQPPHLCEGLSCRSIEFSAAFIEQHMAERNG